MVDFLRTHFRVFFNIPIFLCFCTTSIAQKHSYPTGYYQFPIRPDLANSLAGGLGDLRSNHFHAGLDIRTEQREGLPVYAAAEGYVYKVAVQRSGYGNVIFLRHPNGQTSVYGHLLKFSSALAEYVRKEQYKKQTFEIDLFPQSGQFAFRKGEVIGLSGNTGGSAGPHLHFEIRDSKDNYLNPLYFGFKEIRDVTPPKFIAVALRPLDLNSRINRQFERKVFLPEKLKDGSYRIKETISASGLLGLDLMAHDLMTGTGFKYGLQCIEIKVDGNEIFSYNMEMFPNAATRDYNNLIDYETEQRSGQRYLKCYIPDGNTFDLYKTGPHNGKLYIADTLTHEVSVRVSDSYENASVLTFFVKGELGASELPMAENEKEPEWISSEVKENILVIKAKSYQSAVPLGTFYSKGRKVPRRPDYFTEDYAVFLTDLRADLPDSVSVGAKTVKTNLCKQVRPGVSEIYKSENWSIEFGQKSIFDTLFLTGNRNHNALFVSQEGVALRDYVKISFEPENIPEDKEHSHIYRYLNGELRFVGGKWNGDRLDFETRELGTFVVRPDTVGPRVRLLEHSKTRIRGQIWDGMSGIDQFSAQVDGEWVLLNYDAKNGYLWSEKMDTEKAFEGEVSLRVTDRAGNSTILQVGIVEPPVRKKVGKVKKKLGV